MLFPDTLVSPEGMPWVMQAFSNYADPDLSYEDLLTLGSKLKLAEGWSYRIEVLGSDLTIHDVDGHARIV